MPMLTIGARSVSSAATKTNISQNSDLLWKSRLFFSKSSRIVSLNYRIIYSGSLYCEKIRPQQFWANLLFSDTCCVTAMASQGNKFRLFLS